jgi:hypothetical protein
LRISDRAQYWDAHAVAIKDKILAEAWDEKRVFGVSACETILKISGREDFWIIVAARSGDETEIRAGEATGGRRDQGHPARDASSFFG